MAVDEASIHDKKMRLRQIYKFYKNGRYDAIEHTVTDEEKLLLCKYYRVCDL